MRLVLVACQANLNVLAKSLQVFTEESLRKSYDFGVGGKRKNRHGDAT